MMEYFKVINPNKELEWYRLLMEWCSASYTNAAEATLKDMNK